MSEWGRSPDYSFSMEVIRASGAGRRLPDRRQRAAAFRGHGGAHADAAARAARGDDRAAGSAVKWNYRGRSELPPVFRTPSTRLSSAREIRNGKTSIHQGVQARGGSAA